MKAEKPVRCGCGGEPELCHARDFSGIIRTSVRCPICEIQTIYHQDDEEAIERWNRAMSPTAKVIHPEIVGQRIDECSRCFQEVQKGFPYCPSCGARLVW